MSTNVTILRPPFKATLVEQGPTPTGYVSVTVSAPTQEDAQRSIDAYLHRWMGYEPSFGKPVQAPDGVWRASGHRWDRC